MITTWQEDLDKLNALFKRPEVVKLLDALPDIDKGSPSKDFIDDDDVFDTLVDLIQIVNPNATTQCPDCKGEGYFWGVNEDTRCIPCSGSGGVSVFGKGV